MVLDLGCGTGLLGLMALRAGARKVYFIEEGPIIELARRTIADAGFADKAEFLQANSYQLSLPERVDVVICDHVGYFGFDYGILGLLADARQRFLKPDGISIPEQIDLKLAPVESESCRNLVGRWRDGSIPEEFSWMGTPAANTKHGVQLEPTDLIATPSTPGEPELGAEAPPFMSWTVEFSSTRDGLLDGVAGWFDCCLRGDIHMTNSPTASAALDRPQAFLPLEASVPVRSRRPDPGHDHGAAQRRDHRLGRRVAANRGALCADDVQRPATGQRYAHAVATRPGGATQRSRPGQADRTVVLRRPADRVRGAGTRAARAPGPLPVGSGHVGVHQPRARLGYERMIRYTVVPEQDQVPIEFAPFHTLRAG